MARRSDDTSTLWMSSLPYQPEPHEMDRDVQLSPVHVDIGAYHADVVDAHKLFIVKQLASHRWEQGLHLSFEAFGNDI
jgi:hypothetical protein